MSDDNISTDGNDSAGSLRDFIVDDNQEIEYDFGEEDVLEVPDTVVSDEPGHRRSRRTRRAPQRYVDSNFAQIFMEDATQEEINEIFAGADDCAGSSEEEPGNCADDHAGSGNNTDTSYVPSSDGEDDEEEDYIQLTTQSTPESD